MSATTGSLIRAATARLQAAGVEGARLDAQLLMGHVLGRTRLDLIAYDRDPVTEAQFLAFEALVARRMAREPVSHILGRREFWSLDFAVTEATLAPRADSETLIVAALEYFKARAKPRRILDLGTGTGCLLLALLHEFPDAFGVGVDRNPATARVARDNAARLGLLSRAAFLVGDWATALGGPFDLVISNPPYIASADIPALDPEVARFEPLGALDGGADGLEDYRRLAPDMGRLLADDGQLLFEIGATQGREVSKLVETAGFRHVAVLRDLGGRDRVIDACK
ncbi:peptide chain release factor N(5)-glutamine methyltransferase [Govanella unica]|uniref:Release factor glutamine methyltransferase n=1 Tax=Govanella unica TaxID=2975056 RepID=A0A9X3TUE9_9PROT|nr:peptide chain release factor N(5)-glutamine methyltransferase [Govania unica]MDA5192343.1 peptide chain release factor N(5)-glutamine methyltransferase [Govania unica]